MLLGVRFVKTVSLRYKFKPTSPRDADTANALCLEVCYVPAVCEPFGFVPSDCDIKINTIHEGWCSFLWRRKRDSILARTTRSVFLGRGRPQEVRSTPIPLRIPPQHEKSLNQTTRVQFRLFLAQEEGFEPPWLWA